MPRVVLSPAARRSEILDCAMELFSSRGYDQTSVSDIVEALGLSKGAFYHHFTSKEALLGALARRFAEQAAAAARDVLDDPALDSFSRLNGFLARVRCLKLEQVDQLNAAFRPLFRAENMPLYQESLNAVIGVVKPILARIIAEGVAERTFDTPDPENAAEMIIYLMDTCRGQIIALYAAGTGAEFETLATELTTKVRYIGTVIDRILGLPEGSIELVDSASMALISASMRAA